MDNRVVIQGVYMVMGSDIGRAWAQGKPRESKFVFIGRSLPKAKMVAGLEQCLVPSETPVQSFEHFPKKMY